MSLSASLTPPPKNYIESAINIYNYNNSNALVEADGHKLQCFRSGKDELKLNDNIQK